MPSQGEALSMKKILLVMITFMMLASGVSMALTDAETARYLETLPLVGSYFENTDKDKRKGDVHESGVYYHEISPELFARQDFTFKKGSLKNNLNRLAKKSGWEMIWELESDYKIPSGFTIKKLRMPEIFADALVHLPIKVVFYSRNKVITVLPMYDKRETEVGGKYSVNR